MQINAENENRENGDGGGRAHPRRAGFQAAPRPIEPALRGRDLEADFTIRDRSVSRAHAMIERRRERFVLVDHSSNGSFVTFEGRPETRVHHEELTLVGHGWLAFGQPRAEAVQVVKFRCVDGGPTESKA